MLVKFEPYLRLICFDNFLKLLTNNPSIYVTCPGHKQFTMAFEEAGRMSFDHPRTSPRTPSWHTLDKENPFQTMLGAPGQAWGMAPK